MSAMAALLSRHRRRISQSEILYLCAGTHIPTALLYGKQDILSLARRVDEWKIGVADKIVDTI